MKDYIKAGFVSAIIFFGAAFAIMAFNEDVAVESLFEKIYFLVMGEEKNGMTVLDWSYGIGLGLGILIFFNRFGKEKNGEPTPIELKTYQYERDIDEYMDNEGKESDY